MASCRFVEAQAEDEKRIIRLVTALPPAVCMLHLNSVAMIMQRTVATTHPDDDGDDAFRHRRANNSQWRKFSTTLVAVALRHKPLVAVNFRTK